MKYIKNLIFAGMSAALLGNASQVAAQKKEPLNIIFMVGDGMGVAQVSSAFYFGEGKPSFQQFPIVGLSETSSTSSKVTDSAAGATAFASGQKTFNRGIGVSRDTTALPTILELLRDKGYQTGLISLTSITHATPAAYYAHVKDRDMHEEIALQLTDAKVNFLAGGGLKFFNKRKDKKNLLDDFRRLNYRIDTLSLSKPDYKKDNIYLLAQDAMPNKIEGRDDFLADATGLALNYFSHQKKPFFLMVEGSFIDWGGHAKNPEMMVKEVLDFDKTIGVVMDFVKAHPNTLLVVTADHETGGANLGKYYEVNAASGKSEQIPGKVQVNFFTDQHTATLVPVFAMGKEAGLFSGLYANNMIYWKLIEALKKSGLKI